jgi:uncharacterized protein YjiS (DUF1127 family)
MAFYDTSRPHAAGSLFRAVATLVTEFRDWREAVLTRRALDKLSDHELADIGLLRADLDSMSRRDFKRF